MGKQRRGYEQEADGLSGGFAHSQRPQPPSPATVTFPHYKGFILILARGRYIAYLVCNENDSRIACVYQASHQ
ncbi:hypothetical protein HQ563_10580 [bacterium]|nr:hypothetical protein [bacterium]